MLSIIGVTYAFWILNLKQTGEDKLSSSCFEVSLINEGTAIHLEKAFPILDSDGEELEPYTFTIKNVCNTYAGYQINLESLGKSNTENRLKSDYLKVKINEEKTEGIIGKLGSNENVKTTLSDAYESHKLMTGFLEPEESKNFEFRLWLDGDLTMENTDAMNKTYASKITVTASYLAEENVPPTVDLELALCGNTITATGSGTANAGKQITKYEFKLDGAEGWEDNSGNNTKTFTVEASEKHTVGMKVTDSNGITSEVTKEIQQETVNIYGKAIPVTSCGDGLYEVEHTDETFEEEGWKQTEWRYAGPDPNNYVWFNCGPGASSGDTCEKWRIIGLVNVKTSDGEIDQRLKIIRANSLGDYSWDYKTNGKGSSTSSSGSNDWTDSQLMEMLNDGYYNSSSDVSCYKGSSSSTTCDFTSTGLKESARDMIDKEIIWNLGGSSSYDDVTVSQFYESERGTSVYSSGLPFAGETEWKVSNTGRASEETTNEKHSDESLFRSIALPYPSDYGYATSGGSKGRAACLAKEIYNWYNNDYATECGGNDWLKPDSGYMWTLSPFSSASYSNYVFSVSSDGFVYDGNANGSSGVLPALYLSSKVSITDGTGSSSSPFVLSAG